MVSWHTRAQNNQNTTRGIFSAVKKEAVAVAPSSDYLIFIPKVIGIVQSHYKKDISSKDKKKVVIALVKELFSQAYSDETIIGEILDLTFCFSPFSMN